MTIIGSHRDAEAGQLTAWRRLSPQALQADIEQAAHEAYRLLGDAAGVFPANLSRNAILAGLAMRRRSGMFLQDAAWTVIAYLALGGDKLCRSLIAIELTTSGRDAALSGAWNELRPRARPRPKVCLGDRRFLRRRPRLKR